MRAFGIVLLLTVALAAASTQIGMADIPKTQPASAPAATMPTTYPALWVDTFKDADRFKARELDRLTKDIETRDKAIKGNYPPYNNSNRPINLSPDAREGYKKQRDEVVKQKAELMKLKVPNLPTIDDNIKFGDAGPFEYGQVKVVQIINAKEMRVLFLYTHWVVTSLTSARESSTFMKKPIWLKGLDTSKYADGSIIKVDGSFIVTGTKSFETEFDEKRTEYIVEPLDMAAWQKAYIAWSNETKNPKPQNPPPTQPTSRPRGKPLSRPVVESEN